MNSGLLVTPYEGLALHHTVPGLGNGVAQRIVALIRFHADRASLHDVPPITLGGTGWDQSWEQMAQIEGCTGKSGPSKAELMEGVLPYRSLEISLPASTAMLQRCPHPTTIEGTIAHEICHLRWPSLEHGPEFFARVLTLLRGARFPSRGGWSKTTSVIMAETRQEARRWYELHMFTRPPR